MFLLLGKIALLLAGVLERWHGVGGHEVTVLACVAGLATEESNHEEVPHLIKKSAIEKKKKKKH